MSSDNQSQSDTDSTESKFSRRAFMAATGMAGVSAMATPAAASHNESEQSQPSNRITGDPLLENIPAPEDAGSWEELAMIVSQQNYLQTYYMREQTYYMREGYRSKLDGDVPEDLPWL